MNEMFTWFQVSVFKFLDFASVASAVRMSISSTHLDRYLLNVLHALNNNSIINQLPFKYGVRNTQMVDFITNLVARLLSQSSREFGG